MIQVIDDFLDDFNWFRLYLDSLTYAGQINPVDGVEYPGINVQIPIGINADVITKLQRTVGRRVSRVTVFLRMTREGEDVPHQAHNDATMGQYGMILYLNRQEHCGGGTSFVRHIETGLDRNPVNAEEEAAWKADTNTHEAWDVTRRVDMAPNRALIFDTHLMHRAEAPSGFGSSAKNGRLVMVCFFEVFP